jgi:sugar lactone lactonase YvrE
VTFLGDDVFVVRGSSQQVEVYDAATMTQQRSLAVPGLGREIYCGLAACGVNNCLYIADYNNSVVHRVALTGNNTASKWSVEKGPDGLSVNRSHNVLVAGYSTDTIQEYTTHGTRVRTIALSNIKNPTHVVELSTSEIGVTHGGQNHGFSVVGNDGQIVRSYGKSSGC